MPGGYSLLLLPILMVLRFLFGFFLLGGIPAKGVSYTQNGAKWHHPLSVLDDFMIENVAYTDDKIYDDFNRTLEAILIPRVPATEGHEKVRQYILREMKSLGWEVEQDMFTDLTPHGQKKFSNIIATADPSACRNLVIGCHYDSLHNKRFEFLGAVDSAVPCSMMIHMARILNPLLKDPQNKNRDITLQFVFFDGEEAFVKWSSKDSLYGSRHLAQKWNNKVAFTNQPSYCNDRNYVSYLDRMDVLVLLDLIGTPNPKFYSYFLDTFNLYKQLVDAEYKLNALNLMETSPLESHTEYFKSTTVLSFIEDDHVPFMKRDVPIIHVIPSPFPHVWHKESDNHLNLHHPTINNLNKILRVFVTRYLHLKLSENPVTL